MKKKFKLEDLDCANCAAKMEEAIKKVEGQQLLRRRGGELFALLRRQGGHAPVGLVRDRHAHAARCDDPADLF